MQKVSNFLFSDKRSAILWLPVRLYVGWQWLEAGWEKFGSPAWTGPGAGTAIQGFLNGALTKTAGAHADVSLWYAWFINHIVLPHVYMFSYLVTYGELLVGIALILGIFTGISAGIGAFMNFNYLFAGTVSINPELLLIQLFIIKGRKVAGYIGLDKFIKDKVAKN